MTHVHVSTESLVAFVAGGLPAAGRVEVAGRVRDCVTCQQELAGWRTVAAAAGAAVPIRQPSPALLDAVLTQVAPGRVLRGRLGLVAALVAGQVPLVRRGIWAVSALLFGLGAVVCLFRHSQAGIVLSLVAPLVAALGVCLIYGPEVDPGLEVTAATPTSPWVVLLARLFLVAGYDLVLAVAVTWVVWSWGGGPSFWLLISAWLGPLALLSAVSLLLAVWRGPTAGTVAAFALWGVRALATGAGDTEVLPARQAAFIAQAWATSAPVVATAAVLGVAAVLMAGRRVRLP